LQYLEKKQSIFLLYKINTGKYYQFYCFGKNILIIVSMKKVVIIIYVYIIYTHNLMYFTYNLVNIFRKNEKNEKKNKNQIFLKKEKYPSMQYIVTMW